jgi:hypothetical protein
MGIVDDSTLQDRVQFVTTMHTGRCLDLHRKWGTEKNTHLKVGQGGCDKKVRIGSVAVMLPHENYGDQKLWLKLFKNVFDFLQVHRRSVVWRK